MTKIKCPIIEDLLPLYVDNVCSKESSELIQEHIKECPNCAEKLSSMSENVNLSKEEVIQIKSPFIKVQKRLIKICMITIIIGTVLMLSIFKIYDLYQDEDFTKETIIVNHQAKELAKMVKNGEYQTFIDSIEINDGDLQEVTQMLERASNYDFNLEYVQTNYVYLNGKKSLISTINFNVNGNKLFIVLTKDVGNIDNPFTLEIQDIYYS